MSKQANPAVIGGFVLGALVVIIMTILVFSGGGLLRERIQMVTFFPGSIQGLTVGAPVQFQGVPVGQVTSIGLNYVVEEDSFRIPVHYEVWPQQVAVSGGRDQDVRPVLRRLINEQGLRARLESISIVTGQHMVTLSLNPGLPPPRQVAANEYPIPVPAIPGIRDRLEEMFENLQLDDLIKTVTSIMHHLEQVVESGAISEVIENLAKSMAEGEALLANLNAHVEPLLAHADQAFDRFSGLGDSIQTQVETLGAQLTRTNEDISRLIRNLDGQLDPLTTAATGAMSDAGAAMRAVGEMAAADSVTRIELNRTIAEAGRAARSLQQLGDFLQRHPDALLRGKR
ncbi:MAG: MCE family protein [Chromatiaceae bacterium]|nr:MAG: MCE family protein [Chromatiaceae bacterium]